MSQYPAATSGTGIAVQVAFSNASANEPQLTKVASGLYTLTMKKNQQVTILATAIDAAQANVGSAAFTWKSYNDAPSSGSANAASIGSSPAYGGTIVSVNSVGVITANSEGGAIVEAYVVMGLPNPENATTPNGTDAGKAYGQILVSVVA